MTGWFSCLSGSSGTDKVSNTAPNIMQRIPGAVGDAVVDEVKGQVKQAVGGVFRGAKEAVLAPVRVVQEEQARGQRLEDGKVLHDLHYRRFDDRPAEQRVLLGKAVEAADRLEKQVGKSDPRVAQVKAEIRDAYVERLGRPEVCATSAVWGAPDHVHHLSPGDTGAVIGHVKDIKQMAKDAGVLKFHRPAAAHVERREREEYALRERVGIRRFSPPRPEIARPPVPDPAPRCAAPAPQAPRVYRDERPRTCSPNPKDRYQDAPLPDMTVSAEPQEFRVEVAPGRCEYVRMTSPPDARYFRYDPEPGSPKYRRTAPDTSFSGGGASSDSCTVS